ncbi:MAG TPA: hypothetical protein DCE81_07370 [Cytophagales bacterium]|nr:hypothetical protein [Cytophagales bacterium]
MKRFLLIAGILALIIVGLLAFFRFYYTKKFSPEENVNFTSGDLTVNVFYNSPGKKGRIIFAPDGLVPFGKVWRTGANEPTTFETSQDLLINGQKLKKGKYSVWTIPNEQTWTIIFNTNIPSWGVKFDGPSRQPETDALSVDVPVVIQEKEFENFTINVEKTGEGFELILIWDKTLVAVPFTTQ